VTVSNELMSEGRQKSSEVSFVAVLPLSMVDEATDDELAAGTVELPQAVELKVALAGTQRAALKTDSLSMRKASCGDETSV
jgi:hypothetical protein